ncbi:hypothetical protein BHM03_00028273, partial [Ensete ventricosum]
MLGLQRNEPGLSSPRLSIVTRRGAIGEEKKDGAYRRPGRLSFRNGAFKEGEEERGCPGGSAGCEGRGGGARVRATAGEGDGFPEQERRRWRPLSKQSSTAAHIPTRNLDMICVLCFRDDVLPFT